VVAQTGMDPRLGAAWTIVFHDRIFACQAPSQGQERRELASSRSRASRASTGTTRGSGGIVLSTPEAGLAFPMQTTSCYDECAPATPKSCPLYIASYSSIPLEQMGRAKMVDEKINKFQIILYVVHVQIICSSCRIPRRRTCREKSKPTRRDAISLLLEAARIQGSRYLFLLLYFLPVPAAPFSTLVLLVGADDELASLLDRG
jgi:hypothetical protein